MKHILTSLKNILHKKRKPRDKIYMAVKWPKEHRSEYRYSKMV